MSNGSEGTVDSVPEPAITHLGMKRGQWPVHAFCDAQSAAFWAAESDRHYVWPVHSIQLGARQKAVVIPMRSELTDALPPEGGADDAV